MMNLSEYIHQFYSFLPANIPALPWNILSVLPELLKKGILILDDDYLISDEIAIHKTAVLENNVTLKPPVIVGRNCFIGANSYLRNGVFLTDSCKIGPGCEIKTSIIFPETSLAHFNFVGDSIIGSRVNFEAGSITANHLNEHENKDIMVLVESAIINTGVQKFGSLVGDNSKIGANAVLSPGTILKPGSIVKRLELIEQIKIN